MRTKLTIFIVRAKKRKITEGTKKSREKVIYIKV